MVAEVEEIIDLGISEEYVYDIGMVDTPHTFFANDILIHNSVFLNYGKLLRELGIDTSNENYLECVEKCLDIDKHVDEIIKLKMEDITTNIMMTPNMYKFESEEVISKMLIPSKKKYIAKIVYDKTTGQYPENEMVVKGMEFKKSNLSDPIKNILKDLTIKIMEGDTKDNITNILRDTFNTLPQMPIDDIAYAQGVRNIDQYTYDTTIKIYDQSKADVCFPNKIPYHVAGAIVMNALIDHDTRLSDMNKIREGDKGKIVFVTPVNIFGVKAITLSSDSDWNPILYEYFTIDIEYMFDRLILGPLQPTLDAMKYKINLDSILGYKFLDSSNNFVQSLLF
jgi:DNA polymerase elongation subunit (family B)